MNPAERVGSVTWSFRVEPSGRLGRFHAMGDSRDLRPGEVRLRFLAGGICGSDIGVLAGLAGRRTGGDVPIAPLHEIVGRVLESRDGRLVPGQAVVGTGSTGLASVLIEHASSFIEAPSSLSPWDAVAVQSVSTVLRAAGTLPPVVGHDVVVLGTGPIGLVFIHVLKHFGARSVTAVDPVEGRSAVARRYGADEFFACTGQRWALEHSDGQIRPSIVIDAVGRQPDIIAAALRAVADDGFVLGFGAAGDGDYPIPFGEMYHRRLTLASGRTRDGWVGVLEKGAEYLLAHRSDFVDYVSHRFPVEEAQRAYDFCSEPDAARAKVALVSTQVAADARMSELS